MFRHVELSVREKERVGKKKKRNQKKKRVTDFLRNHRRTLIRSYLESRFRALLAAEWNREDRSFESAFVLIRSFSVRVLFYLNSLFQLERGERQTRSRSATENLSHAFFFIF